MRKLCALFALVSTACGPTPESICREKVLNDCEHMYTCNVQPRIGTDVSSCATMVGSFCPLIVGPKNFDVDALQKCTADAKVQTCAEADAGQPASCTALSQ